MILNHQIQGEEDVERLLARLAEYGHRLTGPRREIVAALMQKGSGTAQELFEELRDAGHGIGRATVFRTLEVLSQVGAVERVHRPDGCHTYVLKQTGHSHRLVCADCGTMVEFTDCALDDLLTRLERRTAFRIEGHWLEVFGLCGDCQSQRSHSA